MLFATIRYAAPGSAGTAPYTSWATASNDLQAVINASVAGDEIWVAAGTYYPLRLANATGTVAVGNRNNAFVLKSGVKLYGGFTGTETLLGQRNWNNNVVFLSGDIGTPGVTTDNCYHVVISAGAVTTAELNGFTISNGNANVNSTLTINSQPVNARLGGGIMVYNSAPIISNCVISNNASSLNGGGAYLGVTSTASTISNCAFTGNTSASGGGFYITTVSALTTLSNCSFHSNISTADGGGFYAVSSVVNINNSIFSANTAGGGGGGFFLFTSVNININNCLIAGNTAQTGGGVRIASSAPRFNNSTIASNNTTSSGGGLYFVLAPVSGQPLLYNCIIYGNRQSGSIVSNVFTSSGGTAATPDISYSIVENTAGYDDLGNNAILDPLFVSPQPSSAAPTTAGDYRLQLNSPAINSGSNSFAPVGNDLSGNIRIRHSTVDKGPYEAAVPPPTLVSYSPASGPVGSLVTITGTGFNSPVISIGSGSAIPISITGTSVTAMVMPGATTGIVTVTTFGGSASSSSNFTITAAQVPNKQLGGKLVGNGTGFGASVALSADGNTAVVGETYPQPGGARVYTRSGASWLQQGNKLIGTGAVGSASQGHSVSLSADGNTAIIGGPFDNSESGGVWIFTRNNGVWSQQGNKLVGTGAVGDAYLGASVSLSADGNTALVGGYGDNSNIGAVWIFTCTNGVWSQQGNKLVGTGYIGAPAQGNSVALSADGNTAIIGGPFDNSESGGVWIFTRNNGVWSQQGNKLVGTGAVGDAYLGASVSLSADGNTAIAGGPGDVNGRGAVWVFTRVNSVWSQQGNKLVGTGYIGAPTQGNSVALSADGNTAIVGGPEDNNFAEGAAWIFTRSNGEWSQQGNKLVGSGSVGPGQYFGVMQGRAVALSADGKTAMIGGPNDNDGPGAAWVFVNESFFVAPTLAVSNTPQIYNGSPIPAVVISNSAGAISDIKYNGSGTVPTNAGTYAITADQAADGVYSAVNDAPAGNFIIHANQSNADFRSKANGAFSSVATWEYDLGSGNFVIATQAPGSGNSVSISHIVDLDQDFTVGAARNFTLNAGASLTVKPSRTLTVNGIADFAGQPVIFASDSTGTASLGQVNGTLNNATNVTVERYIRNNGFRSWRLLSVPVTSTQTIRQAWQEGDVNPLPRQNNLPGFGTQITGAFGTPSAAIAAGFDSISVQASMLRWNGTGWSNIASTNQAINNFNAYFLYIRGDRGQTVSGSGSNSSATRLRTKGTIYTGDQVFAVPANTFALIPNLYPSAINFDALPRTGGVYSVFYIWDSKKIIGSSLGAYQTFSATNNYECLISGGSYNFGQPNTTIESGQSFFVQSQTAGAITLKESAKISGTPGMLGFRPAPGVIKSKIDTRLYNSSNEVLDAATVVFDELYSKEISEEDAPKMGNPAANFAIESHDKILAVEGRKSIKGKEIIQFHMWNLTTGSYKLEVAPEHFILPTGTEAILEDRYLGTQSLLSATSATTVNFNVDQHAASSVANRFRLVIDKAASLKHNGFTICPNPVEGKVINLLFRQQMAGKYSIRIVSANGQLLGTYPVVHAGGTYNYLLNLQPAIEAGMYSIEIFSSEKKLMGKTILVN